MSKTKTAKTKKTAPKKTTARRARRTPKQAAPQDVQSTAAVEPQPSVAELHAAARLARRAGDVETAAKLTEQAHVKHAESK